MRGKCRKKEGKGKGKGGEKGRKRRGQADRVTNRRKVNYEEEE